MGMNAEQKIKGIKEQFEIDDEELKNKIDALKKNSEVIILHTGRELQSYIVKEVASRVGIHECPGSLLTTLWSLLPSTFGVYNRQSISRFVPLAVYLNSCLEKYCVKLRVGKKAGVAELGKGAGLRTLSRRSPRVRITPPASEFI